MTFTKNITNMITYWKLFFSYVKNISQADSAIYYIKRFKVIYLEFEVSSLEYNFLFLN